MLAATNWRILFQLATRVNSQKSSSLDLNPQQSLADIPAQTDPTLCLQTFEFEFQHFPPLSGPIPSNSFHLFATVFRFLCLVAVQKFFSSPLAFGLFTAQSFSTQPVVEQEVEN